MESRNSEKPPQFLSGTFVRSPATAPESDARLAMTSSAGASHHRAARMNPWSPHMEAQDSLARTIRERTRRSAEGLQRVRGWHYRDRDGGAALCSDRGAGDSGRSVSV